MSVVAIHLDLLLWESEQRRGVVKLSGGGDFSCIVANYYYNVLPI